MATTTDYVNLPIYKTFRKNPVHDSIFILPVENALQAIREFCTKYDDNTESVSVKDNNNVKVKVKKYVFVHQHHYIPLFPSYPSYSSPVIINNNVGTTATTTEKAEKTESKKKTETEKNDEVKTDNAAWKFYALLFGASAILGTAAYFITDDYIGYQDSKRVMELIKHSFAKLQDCVRQNNSVELQPNYSDICSLQQTVKPILKQRKRYHSYNAICKSVLSISTLVLLYGLFYGQQNYIAGFGFVSSIVGYIVNRKLFANPNKSYRKIVQVVDEILARDYPLYPATNPEYNENDHAKKSFENYSYNS